VMLHVQKRKRMQAAEKFREHLDKVCKPGDQIGRLFTFL
jgi:hypothetical protein